MRARAVVAERETAPADDRLLAPHAGDRRGAGAGDDQPAIRARMGADAGGRSHRSRRGRAKSRERPPRPASASLSPLNPASPRPIAIEPPIGFVEARPSPEVASTSARKAATAASKSTWILAAAPLASASAFRSRRAAGRGASGAAVDAEVERARLTPPRRLQRIHHRRRGGPQRVALLWPASSASRSRRAASAQASRADARRRRGSASLGRRRYRSAPK